MIQISFVWGDFFAFYTAVLVRIQSAFKKMFNSYLNSDQYSWLSYAWSHHASLRAAFCPVSFPSQCTEHFSAGEKTQKKRSDPASVLFLVTSLRILHDVIKIFFFFFTWRLRTLWTPPCSDRCDGPLLRRLLKPGWSCKCFIPCDATTHSSSRH